MVARAPPAFIPSAAGHSAVRRPYPERMVSDRGGKYGYVVKSRQDVYRALRRKGYSKSKSARIANAGRSKGARKAMGRRAAAHRRARGR